MPIWLLRIVWATLPLTAGAAAATGVASWSPPPQILAAALLWATWAAGLLATLVWRPVGLTALRLAAPAFFLLAVVVAVTSDASAAARAAAIAATGIGFGLASRAPVARAAVNGAAYGDEDRYPLRAPPALLLGPLTAAPPLTAAGIATGPLLLADGRIVAGAFVTAAGGPLAWLLIRAVHSLSRRFVVLVPAGLVVADPLTLSDPVLFVRQRIAVLEAVPGRATAPADVLDLRLGALTGTTAIRLDRATETLTVRRAVGRAEASGATELWVAPVARDELLARAASRRIRVAPPSAFGVT